MKTSFRFLFLCLAVAISSPVFTAARAAETLSPAVDLEIGKQILDFSAAEVEQGALLRIELLARNKGDTPANMVVVEDYYAQNGFFSIVSKPNNCVDDGRKLVCSIDKLAAGESVKITYTARVSVAAKVGENTAMVTIAAREADKDPTNNNDRISLRVQKPLQKRILIGELNPSPTMVSDFDNYPEVKIKNKSTAVQDDKNTDDLNSFGELLNDYSFDIGLPIADSVFTVDIIAKPKVAVPEGNITYIIDIANTAAKDVTNAVSSVFFPFDALDLISATDQYSFQEKNGTLVFKKAKLAPGERWVIRLEARVKPAGESAGVRLPFTVSTDVTARSDDDKKIGAYGTSDVLVTAHLDQAEAPKNQPAITKINASIAAPKLIGSGTSVLEILLMSLLLAVAWRYGALFKVNR